MNKSEIKVKSKDENKEKHTNNDINNWTPHTEKKSTNV